MFWRTFIQFHGRQILFYFLLWGNFSFIALISSIALIHISLLLPAKSQAIISKLSEGVKFIYIMYLWCKTSWAKSRLSVRQKESAGTQLLLKIMESQMKIFITMEMVWLFKAWNVRFTYSWAPLSYSVSLFVWSQEFALTDQHSQGICIVRTTVNDLIHNLSLQEGGKKKKKEMWVTKHLFKSKVGLNKAL